MIPYIEEWMERGVYPNRIIRHMLGLFAHRRGASAWKRYLSENAHKPGTRAGILRDAMQQIPDEVLDERLLPDALPHIYPSPFIPMEHG